MVSLDIVDSIYCDFAQQWRFLGFEPWLSLASHIAEYNIMACTTAYILSIGLSIGIRTFFLQLMPHLILLSSMIIAGEYMNLVFGG